MSFTRILTLPLTILWSASACSGAIDFPSQVLPILEEHCFKCHGEKKQKGKLRLDTLSPDLLKSRIAAETWHDVRDALNLGEMPPEEEPELFREKRQILVGWVNQEIDALIEAKKSTGGRVVLRRLNRSEYQNTMRDLLGIEHNYVKDFPPESLSEDGFRNDGSTLQISDLQMEYYLKAAREGLRKAIVLGPRPKVTRQEFTKTVKDKNRGGNILDKDQQFIVKLMEYPEEGEVIIRTTVRAKHAENRGYPQLRAAIGYRADVQAPREFIKSQDVVSEDWQEFEFRSRIENFPLPSKTQSKFPGLLVWLDNAYAEGRDKPLKARGNGKKKKQTKGPLSYPQIEVQSVEFIGPVFEQWPPRHHTALLAPRKSGENEAAHVSKLLTRFMSRAFRRPVDKSETLPYLKFYQSIRPTLPSFEEAIQETFAMILISPDFLYLVEPSSETKRPLNDWEMASRLSYFLWSTMPDPQLFKLAREKKLRDSKVLQSEIERMISDERSWQFIEQFADQWLDLGAVQRVAINPNYYPKFDDALKTSMRQESLHFFKEIFQQDLSALNFLDSKFTMLNEPLAKHYGLTGPRGSSFERVALNPKDHRGGVLTHGSVLLGNSTGEDSHPVKRAVWIRERLLDDPPSDPPPNVPNLDATNPDFANLSVRDQLAAHREEASCKDCHRGIDPWGIPMENYGGDGLWRDNILRKKTKGKGMNKLPVETEAILPDGHEIGNIADLKSYLLKNKKDQFAKAFTSKLLTYALGRRLEITDEKAVEDLTGKFIANNFRIKPLIQLVVASETFQTK
ncbi:MAG: DUF1592 domain-containing protein [Akkermansiaceae bacterium]|nr:DUF1592 domain-containing protein [Akkermansiaceae bacterium]